MVFQFPPTYTLYAVVCVLMFPTVILSWTSLVAPYDLVRMKEVGALVITPREGTVGPSIWLGVFRSCSRRNESYLTKCDYSSHLKWKPNYDVSVLPHSAPLFTLRVPPPQLRTIAWITTFFSTLLWILAAEMAFTSFHYRPARGRRRPRCLPVEMEPLRIIYVIGSGCVASIGFVNYVLLWIHFKKACDNFNVIYRRPGQDPSQTEYDIHAHIGNVINLAYGGYLLLFFPFLLAFVELHQDRGNWAKIFYQPLPAADPNAAINNNGGNGAGAGRAGGG